MTKLIFPRLNLNGIQLSDDDIDHISEFLKTNTTLKGMSAARCNISVKGGKAIGEALMVNRSLQVLDLHDNPISTGVVHIAESLKQNDSLLEISLEGCGTEEGAKAISDALMLNTSLQVLHLHENCISRKECEAIGDALKVNRSLQVLDLPGKSVNLSRSGTPSRVPSTKSVTARDQSWRLWNNRGRSKSTWYFSQGKQLSSDTDFGEEQSLRSWCCPHS